MAPENPGVGGYKGGAGVDGGAIVWGSSWLISNEGTCIGEGGGIERGIMDVSDSSGIVRWGVSCSTMCIGVRLCITQKQYYNHQKTYWYSMFNSKNNVKFDT